MLYTWVQKGVHGVNTKYNELTCFKIKELTFNKRGQIDGRTLKCFTILDP